jgi:hypothetical protein
LTTRREQSRRGPRRPTGTRRRLQALIALGWPRSAIACELPC